MPRQALDVPAVRLPLEPLADEQPVERAALKIPHLDGGVVGARRVLGVGRAVREVADRRVGVRLELLDAVERRLPVLEDAGVVARDHPLLAVRPHRDAHRRLVRLLRRLEVEREPAPQREHPVVRARQQPPPLRRPHAHVHRAAVLVRRRVHKLGADARARGAEVRRRRAQVGDRRVVVRRRGGRVAHAVAEDPVLQQHHRRRRRVDRAPRLQLPHPPPVEREVGVDARRRVAVALHRKFCCGRRGWKCVRGDGRACAATTSECAAGERVRGDGCEAVRHTARELARTSRQP